jgi:hypothetical protein
VQELPSRLLIYGPEGGQIERTSEKIARLVVIEGSDCFHYVRSCLEGELGQTWRAEGVMLRRRRRLRIAQRVVEWACFLKNWSLYHEAGKRDEKRRRREGRGYQ